MQEILHQYLKFRFNDLLGGVNQQSSPNANNKYAYQDTTVVGVSEIPFSSIDVSTIGG